MSNRGVVPPDLSTEVGRLRVFIGDKAWQPLDPPEPGWGEYAYFGDDELAMFLEYADGSHLRAASFAARKIAEILTLRATSVQTDDLRIQTLDRARAYRDLARDWAAEADVEEERASADIFEVVPFSRQVKGLI